MCVLKNNVYYSTRVTKTITSIIVITLNIFNIVGRGREKGEDPTSKNIIIISNGDDTGRRIHTRHLLTEFVCALTLFAFFTLSSLSRRHSVSQPYICSGGQIN